MHLVPNLQMKVAGFRMIAQINAIAIVANDVLRSRICIKTTVNELSQPNKYNDLQLHNDDLQRNGH